MDLTTRCPSCGTTFAASLEQLQLRKGYIRCVQCAHIFDGYEAVVPADSTQLESPAPSVVRGRREFTISAPDAPGAAETEPFLRVPPHGAQDDSPADFVIDTDSIRVEPDRLAPEDHIQVGADEHDAAAHYAEMWRERVSDVPSQWWRSLVAGVWALVIIVGIVVFMGQLAYVFRVQLAENIPALRPALERFCESLDCTVAYSRQPDMIVIAESSLQQEVTEGENGSVLLQFTLRNVHDRPQEWPTVVLELNDFSGAMIARKHLPKDVYLPVDQVNTPFPANSERIVELSLTTRGLEVNGYQLDTFFP